MKDKPPSSQRYEGQARRKKVKRALASLKLRRASGSAAYNISGNSQAIPELFLAQDQVVGYLLKIVVEPRCQFMTTVANLFDDGILERR
jgi:hypothetical protein